LAREGSVFPVQKRWNNALQAPRNIQQAFNKDWHGFWQNLFDTKPVDNNQPAPCFHHFLFFNTGTIPFRGNFLCNKRFH
jgi:hypothetical protein